MNRICRFDDCDNRFEEDAEFLVMLCFADGYCDKIPGWVPLRYIIERAVLPDDVKTFTREELYNHIRDFLFSKEPKSYRCSKEELGVV